jgi:hypothetical protein
MKQILHIFAKDCRHFWPEVLISLALVGALVRIYPSTWLANSGLYAVAGGGFLPGMLEAGFLATLLTVLVPVSWWLLIARVVHAEALVGDRQFWVTRPYEWKKLLAAKTLFLVVFLYLPLLIGQCLLLLRAGFQPLSFVPGLLFNLLLITAVIVLPLLAITTVTATFARVTVTLLAGLACFIGYIAVSLYLSDSASIPYRDHVSLPLAFCFCGVVVVLQYASRRVWVSRLVLGALPILLVLTGMTVSESDEVRRDYPRASAGQEAPVQLALLRDAPHPATAYLNRSKQVQVSIPLQVSGVAEGYALLSSQVKVSADAANGSHWNSAWQGLNNQYYLPGTSESWITFQMSRAFFDQVRTAPVTLHFTVALTRVQAGNVRSIPLPMQDFSVPDFGICSPQAEVFQSRLLGVACRFAVHQPKLTYIRARWMDSPCSSSQPGLDTGVQGDAWIGSLESSPADFAIAPVWSPSIALSNGTNMEGNKPESRYLCPGTPVTFTQYHQVGRTQYDFTIPDFRLPSYQPNSGSLNGALGFDITAQ